jgi:acyl carrier protein
MRKFSKKEIETKVKEAISEELGIGVEQITMDSKMADDLKADSIDAVDITMHIERDFYITVPDEKFYAMTACKVCDICELVDQLQSRRA